jgi:hypothetical protein
MTNAQKENAIDHGRALIEAGVSQERVRDEIERFVKKDNATLDEIYEILKRIFD